MTEIFKKKIVLHAWLPNFKVTVFVEFPLAGVIIQCKVNQIPIYFLFFVLTVFV